MVYSTQNYWVFVKHFHFTNDCNLRYEVYVSARYKHVHITTHGTFGLPSLRSSE
jgi:hypothetical protein